MKTYTYSVKQLKKVNASDHEDKSTIIVTNDKTENTIYIIELEKTHPESKFFLKTRVMDDDYNYLDCTPGVRGGWPYYIADFIHR